VYTYIKGGERKRKGLQLLRQEQRSGLVVREGDAGDGLVVAAIATDRLAGRELPQPGLVV
jgi:hypothetical protein